MKFLKKIKIIDLVVSVIFLILFLYNHRITASYEYGLGQLIQLIVLIPVIISLFISVVMSIIAIISKKSTFIISIIGQALKILSCLLYILLSTFVLSIKNTEVINFMILVFIYGVIILTILIILNNKYKKTKGQSQ